MKKRRKKAVKVRIGAIGVTLTLSVPTNLAPASKPRKKTAAKKKVGTLRLYDDSPEGEDWEVH